MTMTFLLAAEDGGINFERCDGEKRVELLCPPGAIVPAWIPTPNGEASGRTIM
jgi:hypothetical protein